MPRRSCTPSPRSCTAWPLITFLSELRVLGSNREKTSSSSTAVFVWSASMRPPSAISLPLSGPSWRSMKRLAIPDSEVGLTVASVPTRSGAYASSTENVTSAVPASVTLMSVTVPTATPATRTSLPLTSCPALSNSAVTW